MYRDTVNETSHPEGLVNVKCDNCKNPATRWFGSTSVRICDAHGCRERFQQEWDQATSSSEDEE